MYEHTQTSKTNAGKYLYLKSNLLHRIFLKQTTNIPTKRHGRYNCDYNNTHHTRRPAFAPRSVLVGFGMDKVALGQVFLRLIYGFSLSISFHHGSPYSSSGGRTKGPLVAAVQRDSLAPSTWTTTTYVPRKSLRIRQSCLRHFKT
jgi:hypothetical protein